MIIIFILAMIAATITGMESISFSTDSGIVYRPFHGQWKRIAIPLCATGLCVWLYLIYYRKRAGWWIGAVLYGIAIIQTLYFALTAALYQGGYQRLLGISGNIILALLVYVFFGKWWLRKKREYFTRKQ